MPEVGMLWVPSTYVVPYDSILVQASQEHGCGVECQGLYWMEYHVTHGYLQYQHGNLSGGYDLQVCSRL